MNETSKEILFCTKTNKKNDTTSQRSYFGSKEDGALQITAADAGHGFLDFGDHHAVPSLGVDTEGVANVYFFRGGTQSTGVVLGNDQRDVNDVARFHLSSQKFHNSLHHSPTLTG